MTNLKEILAPSSSERIVLVVLFWILLTVGLSRFFNQSLVRWELVLSGILLFMLTIWPLNYRFTEAEQERYNRQRKGSSSSAYCFSMLPVLLQNDA